MEQISIIAQPLIIILLAVYAFILIKSRLNPRIVRRSALIILLAGTAVYMYAFIREGYSEGIVTIFFRSMIASVKLFLYDSLVFETLMAQKEALFLDIYMLVYYAAMLTSFSAILMLFGKRATTFFVLLFRSKPYKHIFLGINSRSKMIAKGLPKHDVAFVEFPGESEDDKISVSNIFKSVTGDDNGAKVLGSDHLAELRAKRRFLQSDRNKDVFEQIGLGRLRKLVDKDTAFYIFSENSDQNLQDLLILVSDETLRGNTIHACVKREGLARSYQGVLGKTGAHMIYPSSLSVVDLMKSPDCHPANVISINKNEDGMADGTVSGEFTAQVIGFGETGQAAAKYIYEFASAIRSDHTPLPVTIYVTDDKLERFKDNFMFSCPSMRHDEVIRYDNFGVGSGLFWSTLIERLDSLNYVVIAMPDDTVNLDLACTLYGYAEKKRKGGFDNFRIYVRKRFTPDYERRLVMRLNEKSGHEVIRCFGEYEKIFTPEMIVSSNTLGINSSATSLAARLRDSYAEIAGRGEEEGKSDTSFHDKRRIRRETHQYISRANHIPTKLFFTGWETDIDEKTLDNMARCEHLRFLRYLTAHGYSFGPEDDDVLKTNHQICAWDKLTDEDRQYHRDMVKASLSVVN